MLSKLAATLSPRQLRYQLVWLTSLLLLLTIFVYAWYSASEQSASERNRAEFRVVTLAQSIGVTSTDAIVNKDLSEMESLLVRTLALPDILEVRITDAQGRLLSHVVRKSGGEPEVRFSSRTIATPAAANAVTRIDYSKTDTGWRYQLGLGEPGRLVVWQPIFNGDLLGWVVVDHDLASTAQIRQKIWLGSLFAGTAALMTSILLLLLFLKRPMGALQTATDFAAKLDELRGAQLPVFHGSSEIESLTTGLNRASSRLLTQSRDLNNQKFAMDQHAIVSITDLKGNITYVNDHFCKISGYSQAELLGQNHRIVNSGFHPPEFFSGLWRTISKGNVWHGALKNRKKDGGYYWVDSTIVPLMGADGRPEQYIGIRTDISELKRVDHMKSEFISTVSHELRTPLTSIRGSLGLIAGGVGGEVPKAVRSLVDIANSNCERLIRLINDILDSEKIESGKMSLDLQVVDIRQLVQQALAANEGFAGQHRVRVRLQAPDVLLQVRIDSDRMTQVLTNLLSNAVKFSPPEGAVEVKVLRVAQQVRVEVADHGPGIPENFRGRIFQKFSQADSSDTRQKGGTGLGLNISKALIEKMGGQIGFSSEAGAGTTFFFELPEWQSPVPPLQAVPTEGVVSRPRILVCEADADVASLENVNPRILHVEDDPDIQRIVAGIARDVADFEFAATLDEAKARLRESRFDLVVLDLGLGKDSGWDLLEDIDALEPPPPVIVFSASDVDPPEGKQAEAVLVKARTSNTELLNTIQRVLNIPGDPGPTRPQSLN